MRHWRSLFRRLPDSTRQNHTKKKCESTTCSIQGRGDELKKLHIVTRSGAGRDIHTPPQNYQRKKANIFPNPDKKEQIMREALNFFKNSTKDQQNSRSQNEDTIQEFLQLLKEKTLNRQTTRFTQHITRIQRRSETNQGCKSLLL
jgi:hypothetical protein